MYMVFQTYNKHSQLSIQESKLKSFRDSVRYRMIVAHVAKILGARYWRIFGTETDTRTRIHKKVSKEPILNV